MNALRQRIDHYTLAILLLVGGVFGTAGALTWRAEYTRHDRQCEVAMTWLEESADSASSFTGASNMSYIDRWMSEQEELNAPNAGKPLRWAILDSARFHQEYRENTSPRIEGVLNSPEFAGRIKHNAKMLTDHCPETAALLPDAFPMVFVKDGE